MLRPLLSISVSVRRSAARLLAIALILIAGFTVNLPPVHAATAWTVTTTADDAAGGTCNSTACTLRDALNTAANGDKIIFDSSLAGKTITLLGSGLGINRNVTIDGSGASGVVVDGNGAFTVFEIHSTAVTATINALMIKRGSTPTQGGGIANVGGTLTVSNCTLVDNSSGFYGGGIYNSGTLTVINSTVAGNFAQAGGGIVNIFHGKLTLTNSEISRNSATTYGGGIFSDGNVTIKNSKIFGNTAAVGGGIENTANGTITVDHTTISSNSAGGGGGIYNFYGTVILLSSTVSDNSATTGIGYGGGIENADTFTVSNSTIVGNKAMQGGGIFDFKLATIGNSTISGNSASLNGGGIVVYKNSTLNMGSTIVAANKTSDDAIDPDIDDSNGTGTINSFGYNLIGDNTGEKSVGNGFNHDLVGTSDNPIDPLLGIVANNGGSTPTMGITSQSPAYQGGFCGGNIATLVPNAPAVTTDQRGEPRKGTSIGCDIGAYELQSPGSAATLSATN